MLALEVQLSPGSDQRSQGCKLAGAEWTACKADLLRADLLPIGFASGQWKCARAGDELKLVAAK